MELQNMSLEELKKLKNQWYKENRDTIGTIIQITRLIGKQLNENYGPKYNLDINEHDIVVYVDDYGHYATAHNKGKLVMSTHNEQLFIPGKWVDIVMSKKNEAEEKEIDNEKKKNEEKRQTLINELSLPL